jgi:hypothetical protein
VWAIFEFAEAAADEACEEGTATTTLRSLEGETGRTMRRRRAVTPAFAVNFQDLNEQHHGEGHPALRDRGRRVADERVHGVRRQLQSMRQWRYENMGVGTRT